MFRLTQILAVVAVSLFVAGCANKFKSDVARFHQLPQPAGETFVVVPRDESKAGSLEFAQYARQIANNLSAYGYRATGSADDADLLVKVDYSVGDGNTMVRSYGGSFSGFYPHYYSHYYWPYYRPFYHDPYRSEVRSYVVYGRRLSMDIVRSSGEVLFEGRVESSGRDNRLPEVMPYLIEAMFADFPGRSGETQNVVIKEGDSGY